jgi:hypothetical protein
MKSQTPLGLYLFWENRIVRFGKLDGPVFATLASCLIFHYLDSLIPFSHLSCFKIPWIFGSSNFSSFLGFVLKLPQPDFPEQETGWSGFSSLAKFGHQHFDPILKLPKPDTLVWQTRQSDFSSLAKFGHQHMPLAF